MSAEKINRYEIIRELGRGGMATVYLAHDPSFDRQVALKLLPREFLHDPSFRKRFQQEAKTIAALEHPAIVPVHDFGEHEGQPFLVMRYMSGGSLGERRKRAPLSPEDILKMLTQLAPALDHAHKHKIVHRDLKPDNILFDEFGNAYLGDFGIAKLRESTAALTGDSIIGTPAYMSPEQAQGEGEIDGSSDLYSLGIVLFESLAGRLPFVADTPIRQLMMHINEDPPTIHMLNQDLPKGLNTVMQKALAKEPGKRYQNAVTLSKDFEAALLREDKPASGVVETRIEAPSEDVIPTVVLPDPAKTPSTEDQVAKTPAGKPSRRLLWVLGGIGVFLVVGFFAVLVVTNLDSLNLGGAPTETTAEQIETLPVAVPSSLECTDALGCVEVAPDEPITMAYMLTTTGATAFLGEDSLGAVEIVIADRGEFLGHSIELIGEDSLCSPEGGQTAATKVAANDSVVGVIGTNCSSAATAALSTISSAGLVMCSPSNTAPALTDDGPDGTWQPGYFRAAHNDLFQGRIAADFAYDILGARSAATIHDGSPYADQLQDVFSGRFAELGGTVTFQGAVNVGDTDMRPVLTSAAADSPDVLYFPIFEPEGPFIVAQSSEIEGLEATTLMGADGLLVASFAGNAGANAEGMYLSGPFLSGPNYDAFLARWADQIGGVPPSGFHAFAADCTNMILDAIEASAQVGGDGTVLVGRQALRDAMTATAGFDGLSGNLSCSPTGDCATGEALGVFEITSAEINDGNWPPEAIWTP